MIDINHDNFTLASQFNSIHKFLAGAYVYRHNSLNSFAGGQVILEYIRKFGEENNGLVPDSSARAMNFYEVENDVSEIIGRGYGDLNRVFDANDRIHEIKFKDNNDVLAKYEKLKMSFEESALHNLKISNTVWVVIINNNGNYQLKYLPVTASTEEKRSNTGELIELKIGDYTITDNNVKIKDKDYPNLSDQFPAAKLIKREVLQNVNWSPSFAYLGGFQNLLSKWISKEYQEFVMAYPNSYSYDSSCTYSDSEGNKCDQGIVRTRDGIIQCPKCKGKIGPGAHYILKPTPDAKAPDPGKAFGYSTVDLKPLEYLVNNIDIEKKDLYEGFTGLKYRKNEDGDSSNDSYQNYGKIAADMQRAKDVLTILSQEWTRVSLWYTQYFFSSENVKTEAVSINLGIDFHLKTKEDYLNELDLANKSGAPAFMKAMIVSKMLSSQYKDLSVRSEAEKWALLEPFPDKTLESITNIATNDEKRLKANFVQYANQLKTDLSIPDFNTYFEINSNKSYSENIKFLKTELEKLAKTKIEDGQNDVRTDESAKI